LDGEKVTYVIHASIAVLYRNNDVNLIRSREIMLSVVLKEYSIPNAQPAFMLLLHSPGSLAVIYQLACPDTATVVLK